MTKLDLFHLEARAPFHFGTRGVGVEDSVQFAPSDTLFSALCNMLRVIEPEDEPETLLKTFRTQPPFLCGGAYPYVRLNDSPMRFYPAPLTLRHESDKDLRSVKWLSERVFDAVLMNPASIPKKPVYISQSTKILVAPDEAEALRRQYPYQMMGTANLLVDLWTLDEVPRVAIDRLTNASNIYRAGRLRFPDGGGLWCAFQWLDAEHAAYWKTRVRTLLTYLGHEGIGGERSSGHGQFELEPHDPQPRDFPDPGERFVTLSHYRPEPDEVAVLEDGAAYELIGRRGWMSSPDGSSYRHKSVRMIAAGSVLNALPGKMIYGGLVDVTPEEFRNKGGHDVWRYGLALAIGVKGET